MLRWMRLGTPVLLFIASGPVSCGGGSSGSATLMKLKSKAENQIGYSTNYGAVNSTEPQRQSLRRSIQPTKQAGTSPVKAGHLNSQDSPEKNPQKALVKGRASCL